jgi:hypothetical protein
MENKNIKLLQKWIASNPDIESLLVEIQQMEIAVIEQARVAYSRISDHLKLPKSPTDAIEYYKAENRDAEEDETLERSVCEEHALLKYLQPDDDPRGLVFSAIYHVYHRIGVDYNEIAEKKYATNMPSEVNIGIKGDDFDAEVLFPAEHEKSWTELGCTVLCKL